jgi:excisionase family DNA binding protein
VEPHAATGATARPRGCRFLTCGEVAAELGVHRSTVTRLVQAGAFPALRLGSAPRGRVRIPEVEYRAWLYADDDGEAA